MEIVELIKAIILGIIQGITEWLPVSSTGHMILFDSFWPMDASQFSGGRAFIDLFLVVIQFGSILAVLVLYFHKLNPFSPKKTPVEKRQTLSLWGKVLIATIPAAIVGLLFDDLINEYFYNAVVVAIMLIAYGVFFLLVEGRGRQPKIRAYNQLHGKTLLLIGLAVPVDEYDVIRLHLEVWKEEKAYLRALPTVPYEIASWEYHRKVYPNCHATLNKNYYSVPYTYRGKYVDIRYTEKLVEIYYDHQRVASHPIFPAYVENRYRTEPTHMPDYFNEPEMNDTRMLSWAATIGPYTNDVIARVFRSVQIKEQGYNAALAILRLSKGYPKDRFEAACRIALGQASSPRYRLIQAILINNQDLIRRDQEAIPKENSQATEESGAFIRGAAYYGGGDPDAE